MYAFKVWYEFERKPCWTCLWWVWIIFRSIPRIIQSSLSAPPWWNMYTCIATGGRLYIVVVVGGANKIQSNKCNKCCRILPMNTNLQMVMQSLCPYFDASMLPFEFREWMGSSLVPPFDNNFSITWKAHRLHEDLIAFIRGDRGAKVSATWKYSLRYTSKLKWYVSEIHLCKGMIKWFCPQASFSHKWPDLPPTSPLPASEVLWSLSLPTSWL